MKISASLVGLGSSVIYVVFLIHLLWDRIHNIYEMKLNEIGDLLAGLFGPLAMLWIILGFYLQREELKQNTAALDMQARELANSSRQLEQLAKTSKEEISIIREERDEARRRLREEMEPSLIVGYVSASPGSSVISVKYKLENKGAAISDVRGFVEEDGNRNLFEFAFVAGGGEYLFDEDFDRLARHREKIIRIEYKIRNGDPCFARFKINIERGNQHMIESGEIDN